MDDQLKKDLASLNLEKTKSLTKLFSWFFKLWFVWALVWLTGVITIVCIAWHFIAKFW